jgi:hypothetical protein
VDQDKSTRTISCLRCQLELRVTTDDRGLILAYDIDHWSKQCCCGDRSSPADCCSFPTLEGMLGAPPRWPKLGS